MKARPLVDLAAHIGGKALEAEGVLVSGVSTDSRAIRAGDLFVAVVGEVFDGNDYVAAAIEAGAHGVVTSNPDVTGLPRIIVADTQAALRDIAAIRRAELEMPVIAITGSTGKTSTKDLLAAALPGAWASPRSYNNEIGVPLTILTTPDDADYLVAEVGSRGRGHIEFLMPAVRPDVAVITNLGVVHLETFGTTDRLADSKFELVEALQGGGTAILPADEPRLQRAHRGDTLTFGLDTKADIVVSSLTLDADGSPRFVIAAGGERVDLRLRLAGAHQALNAAAAVGAGLAVGVDLATLAEGLENATGSEWRMEIHPGRFTVVNDAYNANPDSVEAAMRTVAAMPGRHIAVLGTMAELGPVAESEHERIGRVAAGLGFVAVVTIGDEPGIAQGAGAIGRNVADPEAAYRVVSGLVDDGDTVLVKASRAIGLESLAAELIEEARA